MLPDGPSSHARLTPASENPETAFRGGLYLLDINDCALGIVQERIKRQRTDHVTTIKCDFNRIFLDPQKARDFFRDRLGKRWVHLATLHHSLYYCRQCCWLELFKNLYRGFLAPRAAIHAVLMSSKSKDPSTTTWLYNHFAGKFFGAYNDQDLRQGRLPPGFNPFQINPLRPNPL
jgi:hypothetical protein